MFKIERVKYITECQNLQEKIEDIKIPAAYGENSASGHDD